MKTQTLIITAVLFLSILTSCREHKEVEKKTEADVKIEKVEEQPEVDEDEIRRLDSIRQVKEHGHAH